MFSVAESDKKKILDRMYRIARKSGTLTLAAKQLDTFPPEITELDQHLQPDEKFWECVDLLKIDLSHNDIESIPATIDHLGALTSFKMSQNKLLALPQQLFSLQSLMILDVSNNQLTGPLSPGISKLRNLKELVLSFNRITALPDDIGQIHGLEILSIENNLLSTVPSSIGCLARLTKLAASSNQICHIPDGLHGLKQLKSLDLSKNQIESMAGSLENMEQLVFLDLRQNRLNEFPRVYPNTKTLAQVFVGYNQLKIVPGDLIIRLKDSVTVLDIRDNHIKELPESFCYLVQLKMLDATNNDLVDLPAGLGYLKNLSRMLIDGNPLRAIRRSIINSGHEALKKYLRTRGSPLAGVDCLDEEVDEFTPQDQRISDFDRLLRNAGASGILDLQNNRYTSLPDRILQETATMGQLLQLNLSKNSLKELPRELSYCCNLQILTAEQNLIERIDPAISQLGSLKSLRLQKNSLSTPSLDTFLRHCSGAPLTAALRELDVRNNQIASIPSSLVVLTNLHDLLLAYNKLTSLDEFAWTQLSSLINVNLSDNQISSLGDIYTIPTLTSLHIENNNLSHLPPELGLCTQLKSLMISGNPQRTIRTGTIQKGLDAILESLRNKLPMNQTTFTTRQSNNGSYTNNAIEESKSKKSNTVDPNPAPEYQPQLKEPKVVAESVDGSNVLAELNAKIVALEDQLDNCSLTQAKKYAVKKDLAKVRALRIREERRLKTLQ